MAQEILLTAEAYKKKNDELEYLKTTGPKWRLKSLSSKMK